MHTAQKVTPVIITQLMRLAAVGTFSDPRILRASLRTKKKDCENVLHE